MYMVIVLLLSSAILVSAQCKISIEREGLRIPSHPTDRAWATLDRHRHSKQA